MDALHDFLMGLNIALQPTNFLYCFVGVFVGTLIGVLPGIGPLATIALLLPLTYGLNATTAMILLAFCAEATTFVILSQNVWKTAIA